jgi:hypothetical protein
VSATSTFELLGFTTVAAGAEAALIEVEGSFPGGRPPRAAATRLLVDGGDGARYELPAVTCGGDIERWRASFAVPLAAIAGASFALVVRRIVVELPQPDALPADADRLVRSAREVNALRRQLERVETSAAEAQALRAQADTLREERDALRDDLARAAEDAEREHAEAADRLAAADAARQAAEQALTAVGTEADERAAVALAAAEERARAKEVEAEALGDQLEVARKELAHEREGAEMTVRALREALDASHDETHEVRRHLKHVRAELEALRRDQGRQSYADRPSDDGRDGLDDGAVRAPDDDWGGAAEGVRVLGPIRRTPAEPNGEAALATEVEDAEDEERDEDAGSEGPTSLWDDPADDATQVVHRRPDDHDDPARLSTRSMFAEPRGARATPARQAPLPPITPIHQAPPSSRWLVVALLVVGFAVLLAILFGLLGA